MFPFKCKTEGAVTTGLVAIISISIYINLSTYIYVYNSCVCVSV